MKNIQAGQPVAADAATGGALTAVSSPDPVAPITGRFTDPDMWALVISHARCGDGGLHPDEWFPVSAEPGRARQEAAAAIAVCMACPVRSPCLALSLRHWDIGQHGIWGGLVAADRARLRRRLTRGRTAGRRIAVVRDDSAAVMVADHGRDVRR